MTNINENNYVNLITAMLICSDNGLSPRLVGNSNKIICTISEEVLCNFGLHKKIIKKLTPFTKKMREWQDVTTNTVYLVINAKNY